MKRYLNVLLSTALLSGLAQMAHAQCTNPLIKAIVDEHNRYRTQPKVVADELEGMKQKLIDSRTKGVGNPDDLKTTTDAVTTAIADLRALTPLPALKCDEGGSLSAAKSAKTMNGAHTALTVMRADWPANKAAGNAMAESIASVGTEATDTEKAKKVVRDLFCDWGTSNAARYAHRMFVISYNSPTVMAKDATWLKPRQANKFTLIGVGISGSAVYIQYGM